MIDVRRARDRFHTDIGWLDSWHSFSFSFLGRAACFA